MLAMQNIGVRAVQALPPDQALPNCPVGIAT